MRRPQPQKEDRQARLLAQSLNTRDPAFAAGASRLQLGCGTNLIEGWLNADIVDADVRVPGIEAHIGQIFLMDARETFPFPDGQFQYIYCEDFLEHFSQLDGLHICAECYRVLRPCGVWRISTPSLEWALERNDLSSGAAIDRTAWGWGHRLLYGEPYARQVLSACGFDPVQRCRFARSAHADLAELETRVGDAKLSLILEATKPGVVRSEQQA
jgi:predicted SAM-dependent methyltransferase